MKASSRLAAKILAKLFSVQPSDKGSIGKQFYFFIILLWNVRFNDWFSFIVLQCYHPFLRVIKKYTLSAGCDPVETINALGTHFID